MSIALVLPRPPLHSRYSFEAEDDMVELDELLDLTAFLSGEDKRAGGDGKGYFGSSTLKTAHNLPFPTFARFPPSSTASSPLPSRPARQTLPFPPASPSKRPAFPSPPLPPPKEARLTERKKAHRRSLSTPDSHFSVSLALSHPLPSLSTALVQLEGPALSPVPVGTPSLRSSLSSAPSSSTISSNASSPVSLVGPSIAHRVPLEHVHHTLRRQRSLVRYVLSIPFSVQRPVTPDVPCRDLAATAALLREAEVRVSRGEAGEEERVERKKERRNSGDEAGLGGPVEIKVDGVVFEVLPTIVVEQGWAV